jgi:hypothetical protein
MKIPENLRFIHAKTLTPEHDEHAKGLAREISDTYYPSFDRSPAGTTLLYQTRHAYLEVLLTPNNNVEFEGANTSGSSHIRGRSSLSHDHAFLGAWLDTTS